MRKSSIERAGFLLFALIAVSAILGCSPPGKEIPDTERPTALSTYPLDNATGTPVSATITVTFDEAMAPATIDDASFTLSLGATPVPGTVTYYLPTKTAAFAPDANLANESVYTATITVDMTDVAGNALGANYNWDFTTEVAGLGPAPVSLGTAGHYAILAKTAITTVPNSAITGDIGLSPAAESYLEGFSQTKATGYSTAPQVAGFIYAADMTPPTPANMTVAILDMQAAYTDAAGRSTAPIVNTGAGSLGGLTLAPGLYQFNTAVNIATDLTLDGAANDVWIFQITGTLDIASATEVILINGAKPENVFWQAALTVSLGANSIFRGVIMAEEDIVLGAGATLLGRALAQTAVTLDQAVVTQPTP